MNCTPLVSSCCEDDPIPCCMRTQEALKLMTSRLDRCYEYLDYQNEKINKLMNEIRKIREMVPLVPPVGSQKINDYLNILSSKYKNLNLSILSFRFSRRYLEPFMKS